MKEHFPVREVEQENYSRITNIINIVYIIYQFIMFVCKEAATTFMCCFSHMQYIISLHMKVHYYTKYYTPT